MNVPSAKPSHNFTQISRAASWGVVVLVEVVVILGSNGRNGSNGVRTGNSIPVTSLAFQICIPVSTTISKSLKSTSLKEKDS